MGIRIGIAYYTKDPPCRRCQERILGCHAKCEKYAEYRENCEKARQRAIEEKIGLNLQLDQICRIREQKRKE